MALEMRLVLDGDFSDNDSTDPHVLVRFQKEGRILGVKQVPNACPRCAYTPEHLPWCPEKDTPLDG